MATREELNKEKQKEILDEENHEKRKKIVLSCLKMIITIVIIMSSFFLYVTYVSNKKIVVRERRIISKNLPDNFNGLKIIQFSDIHYGTTIFDNDIDVMVKKINERNPDIVVFTGDLIDKDYRISLKEQEKIINSLSKIKESIGKYAVYGNEDNDRVTTIFNQSEFTILNNESEFIYKENTNPILLVGLNSSLNKEIDIDKAFDYFNDPVHNTNMFTITLLHEPDSIDDVLNKYRTDIALAGHSHNGQIKIPYIGGITKRVGAKKYNQDYYNIGNTKLLISGGIGTNGSGIRLFNHPSINFIRVSKN